MATPDNLSGTDEIESSDLIAIWSSRNRDARRMSYGEFRDGIANSVENDLLIAVESANASAEIAQTAAETAAGTVAVAVNELRGEIDQTVANALAIPLETAVSAAALAQAAAVEATSAVAGAVQQTTLSSVAGAALVGSARDTSSTGLSFGPSNLQILVRSSPIDVREALPGNFDASGAVNYTTQIQKILDYLRDFGGGRLLLPSKTSLLIGGLVAYTGTEIVAQDWTSELIVSPAGFGWGISVNPLNGGTPDPANNQRNIRLSGFSIRGQALTPTFEEHQHLLNMNAVSDLLIERLLIKGHRGDGIYLGSSNTNGLERHNERVLIDRCTIDGVNAENRNGISIIDGVDVTIRKFTGLNCTKAGQPGTIDIEPNANAFTRIKHITIDDFDIRGGNGAGLAMLVGSNDALTMPIQHITWKNGIIRDKSIGFQQITNVAAGAAPHHSVWQNITVEDCATPFILDSVRGAEMNDVRVYRSPKIAQLGYIYGNFDIRMRGFRMYNCGTAETNGLTIRGIDGLLIDDALFSDCGRTDVASGRAIYFASGTASPVVGNNISITNSVILSPTGKTTVNIGVEAATYTLNNSTCRDFNNRFIVGSQQFVVNGSGGLTVAPTTGNWAVGSEVFRTPSAGRPISWKVVAAGNPPAAGTWRPSQQLGGPIKGSTAGRPTKTTMGVIDDADWIGAQYLDTSLVAGGKLITWAGTAWVDATGAVV